MKTRNILAALLLMMAGLQTAWAQGFRVYKSDGTVAQFSLRTDSIVFYDGIGTDVDFGPFTPVNQCIVGTWYKTKSETVTFNEDGTTDYVSGATYEFLPYQGNVIIYNADGAPANYFKVLKVTAEQMLVVMPGGTTFSVWSTEQPAQPVTSITISPASLSLQLNETSTLTATVLPSDADNKEVEWTSSNTAVATVSTSGKVTAVASGTCTVTATAKDGSGVKGTCQVTVAKLVTSITVNPATLTLEPGKSQTLTASVQPSDATNKQLKWSSSNTAVATVSTSGKVTAVASGTCTVTATAKDGSGVKAECQVTVVQPVTSITLNNTTLTLEVGKAQTLTATVLPADATNKQLKWSSSNTAVATVSTSGKVTAVASGTCTVTATAKDGSGVKAECQVTVEQAINGHEYVEIGGLKWATMNVGATTVAGSYETCYGDYYAWGETQPRYESITRWAAGSASFTWRNGYDYRYCRDNYPTYTGTTLDASHDAATANWGGTWRTPTKEEYEALAAACSGSSADRQTPVELTNTITEGGIYWLSSTQTIESAYTGVAGLLFVSASDISKRVFFPDSGCVGDTGFYDNRGCYWSSSLDTSNTDCAYHLSFYSSIVYPSVDSPRYIGLTVRPVSD